MGAEVETPYKKLGAWAAKAINTTYQAATDGYVAVYHDMIDNDVSVIDIKTDGSTPPTAIKQKIHITDNWSWSGVSLSMSSLIKKNDYWNVTRSGAACGTTTVFWIPWNF